MDSTVGRVPWDLNRKGFIDQRRHLDKLRDVLKEQLPHIIGEIPLTGDANKEIRIPIRYVDLPRFRFGEGNGGDGGAGAGDGSGHGGDVLGRRVKGRGGAGSGGPAGNEPGDHEYEMVLSLDEAIALVFELLELPRLDRRLRGSVEYDDVKWTSRRRKGPLGTLDRRQTLKEAILRTGRAGVPTHILEEDLRFRDWTEQPHPVADAVVVLLRDVSGSMDETKTYLARMLAFWVLRWLGSQYRRVPVEFWVHDVRAFAVPTEQEFFTMKTAGGTAWIEAYEKIHVQLNEHYPASQYNRYVLHLTDGDCYDVQHTVPYAQQLCEDVRWFGYAEVGSRSPGSASLQLFNKTLPQPPFRGRTLAKVEELPRVITELMESEYAE